MWRGVGECLLLLTRAAPGPIGLLFLAWYGWALQASFVKSRCPFGFFSWRFCKLTSIYVAPLLLGGDHCRSLGDQPPVLAPRGDPTRLGDLSVDQPLVVLLYTVSFTLLFRVIFYLSLVEVNQAILA